MKESNSIRWHENFRNTKVRHEPKSLGKHCSIHNTCVHRDVVPLMEKLCPPLLLHRWASQCLGINWRNFKLFSETGELFGLLIVIIKSTQCSQNLELSAVVCIKLTYNIQFLIPAQHLMSIVDFSKLLWNIFDTGDQFYCDIPIFFPKW